MATLTFVLLAFAVLLAIIFAAVVYVTNLPENRFKRIPLLMRLALGFRRRR